ncbi:MAG: YitT family protein [Candidatus Cloacimonetes bacterium]|nr:YitT family protein [Candidatus Cloacimonadota bacterium]
MLKLKTKHISRELYRYLGIIFGSLFFAMGYSWFLLPYNIAPGGVGGISQILSRYTGIPNGIGMILINVPLFIIGFIFVGKSFGTKSIYGMLVASLMTDLFNLKFLHNLGIIKNLAEYTHQVNGHTIYAFLPPEDMLLTAVAGSVLLGLGLGLIFRFRGSTGGTDIPVALVKQRSGLSIGSAYYVVETGIILAVAIFLKDPKILIWGYINLFITTKITDLASEGLPYNKGVYIVSKENDEIKEQIYRQLNRGVTFFKARGGYAEKETDVLFCVLNRSQVPQLTDIVKDTDSQAFMIVTDVYDVLGYGFKSRKIDLSDKKK